MKTANRIKLPLGWYMELDDSTRDEGYQGFVFRPDGRESASLAFAREVGTTSGDDETELPPAVFDAINNPNFNEYE